VISANFKSLKIIEKGKEKLEGDTANVRFFMSAADVMEPLTPRVFLLIDFMSEKGAGVRVLKKSFL